MKKRKTWLDAILIGFIILITLMAVGYTIVSTTSKGKVQSELDKIRAKGEPVTVHDLVPEPIPDAVNGAVVYNKAFVLMDSSPYKSDSDIIGDFSSRELRKKKPELWDDVESALERNSNILDLISKATKLPKCQFPVKWEDGAAAMFPHYATLREVARLESAAALTHARHGDMDAATDAINTGLKASASIKDEPALIAQLVRVAMINISLRSLQDSIASGSFTESQARQLESTLSQIDLRDGFVKALLGERAMGMWAYDEIKKTGPASYDALAGVSDRTTLDSICLFVATRNIGRPMLNADQSYYLRHMTEQIDLAKKPYYQVTKITPKVAGPENAPSYAPVTKSVCPIFDCARRSSENCMANIAVARVGLGLIAYKDRFGIYPQSLAKLKSKLGWETPKDPFDGKDLKYKKTDKGFVLYSIGLNMVNDGGRAPDPKMNDPCTGDVVWKVEN